MPKIYDYTIIGGGIAGCCVAHFLSQQNSNILLIDQHSSVAQGASGAAGAFLSPLLGKANAFKTLVNDALRFSIMFYKTNFGNFIINNGVLRIPKNEIDRQKFFTYEKDFDYTLKDDGFFFDIGSLVFSKELCNAMTQNIDQQLNCHVKDLRDENGIWIINNSIKTKNIIFTTGADVSLIQESYIHIRPVWGQRIICNTTSNLTHSYHKECSISPTINHKISIGATHHRFVLEKETTQEDSQKLISLANDITPLENIEVVEMLGGARSASEDYFPYVGGLVHSVQTLSDFPQLKNGTHVRSERFTYHPNLFILNGLGGRGFVLAPYLANMLVEHLLNQTPINEKILPTRSFIKDVRK